jgi:hypothetical protein
MSIGLINVAEESFRNYCIPVSSTCHVRLPTFVLKNSIIIWITVSRMQIFDRLTCYKLRYFPGPWKKICIKHYLRYKIMWRIDPLLSNARNTHAANNTVSVFSVVRARIVAMQGALGMLTRARWRHTAIEVMQAGVLCRPEPRHVLSVRSVQSDYKKCPAGQEQ